MTSGQATISSSDAVMNVNQSSQKSIINWGSFSVGSGARVNFNQPNSSSQTLNRVVGGDASQIYGKINANGQVLLINPNGVVIGQGAQISANGVVVSTLDITDENFKNGAYTFERKGASGSVVNEGTIATPQEGYVALLGVNVTNKGTVDTGRAVLASGDKIEIPVTESGLVTIEATFDDAQVSNEGAGVIRAKNVQMLSGGAVVAKGSGVIDASNTQGKGGSVRMVGKTVKVLDKAVIKANGKTGGGTISIGDKQKTKTVEVCAGARVEANATGYGDGGSIIFWSSDATSIAGSIFAQGGAEGGNGGFVETSSKGSVRIADTAVVNTLAFLGKTGTWLLDPVTYTIAASGGDETGDSVEASLAASNRTISADTLITINDAISWSANTLTLTSGGDIVVNAVMSATGTAGLVLTTTSGALNMALGDSGFSGRIDLASGTSLTINGHAYTIINSLGAEGSTTATDLQGMNGNLSGYYALGSDIDASATSGWEAGAGFNPVGNSTTKFTGAFNGLGHTVTGLYINRSTTDYIGLFGYSSGASIRSVGVVDADIIGGTYVGGVSGEKYAGSLTNSYGSGTVQGSSYVGGLVGYNDYGGISTSFSASHVVGTGAYTGGVVGYDYEGTLHDNHATGVVEGATYVGGMAGETNGSDTDYNFATGNVSGTQYVGGLIGYGANGATIDDSYATGVVNGGSDVGGLCGKCYAQVRYSYATGAVTATGSYAGGLLGTNGTGGQVVHSWSSGEVSGSAEVGGLVGENYNATVTQSYTSSIVTGATDVGGLIGKNTANGIVSYSHADGDVTATGSYVGGLVGINYAGPVSYSYATGNVSGVQYVGGLVGYNRSSTVTYTYATGKVTGTSDVGGLVGWNYVSTISDSYATGYVIGSTRVGGLLGQNSQSSAYVNRSFSTGVVSGSSSVGGLVGTNSGTVTDSFWNTATSGQATSAGGTGLTSAQMMAQGNYSGLDFSGVWAISEGATYPYLQWQGTPGIITATSNLAAGQTINVALNGAVVGSGSTAADGSVYVVLADGAVSAGDDLLLYNVGGGASAANAVYVAGSNIASGLSLTSGTLWANSGNGVLKTSDLLAAVGSLTSSDFLYTVSSGDITLLNTTTLNNTSSGGVTVDTGVAWSANTLTISPTTGDININDIMDATGTAGLVMTTAGSVNAALTDSGFTGKVNLASGTSLTINGHAYTIINSLGAAGSSTGTDLQGIRGNLSRYYALGSDIDASETSTWNSGAGFAPIGAFTGALEGLGHTVSSLTINRTTLNDVAFMQSIGTSAVVSNFGLANASVKGVHSVAGIAANLYGKLRRIFFSGAIVSTGWTTGGLVAYNNASAQITSSIVLGTINSGGPNTGGIAGASSGSVIDSHTAVTISGGSYNAESNAGGVVGNNSGSISSSYSTGTTGGANYIGGISGRNAASGTITGSYATGNVSGRYYLGGLVGQNAGTIDNSYYGTGTVSSTYNEIGGLVGVNSGTITNSHTGAVVSGYSYIGGLTGTNSGTISDSYETGSVSGSSWVVGGLTSTNSGSITRSYATGNVSSGGVYTGGLVGSNSGPITDSYATGTITAGNYNCESNAGGLVGYNDSATITRSYATGTVNGANWLGGLVGRNVGTGSIVDSYATGAVNGRYYVGGLVGENGGTIDNSYYGSASITSQYDDIGGLVGVNSGTIRNSHTSAAVVSGYQHIGGLVGRNSGTIETSYALGDASGSWQIGGLVGANSGSIDESYAEGDAYSIYMYRGGLVGYNTGAISDSHATGAVTGGNYNADSYAGGLVGLSEGSGSITGSYATGNVSGADLTGGLVGQNTGTGGISDSYATGNVSGRFNTGGLVGLNSTAIDNSYYGAGTVSGANDEIGGFVGTNSGTVTNGHTAAVVSGSYYVGGFAGSNSGTIEASYATGTASGEFYIGGFAGSNSGTITLSHALGNVTSASGYTGGLVGYNTGAVSYSFALGEVSGGNYNAQSYAGGLVGSNTGAGSISYSFATGYVHGTDYVGGLVGINAGTAIISNSYSTGTASGRYYVGGLLGGNSSSVTNSFSVGRVVATGTSGGLIAENTGTVTGSYWNTESSGKGSSAGGAGRTTSLMKALSNYTDWDFSTVWAIVEGVTYPYLRMQGDANIITAISDLAVGQTIKVVVDGAVVGSGMTAADKSVYVVLPEGTYAAGDDLLLYNVGGGASAANAVYVAGGNIASGLSLSTGVLWANSGNGVLKTSDLVTAVGSLTSSDFLYTVSSGDITLLNTTTLTNTSSGGVTVDTGVAWSANTLTISPTTGDININDIMDATGTARLVMATSGNVNAALSAAGFTGKVNLANGTSLNINSHEYTIINSLGAAGSTTGTDLQGMIGNRAGYYALGSDIDASATSGWNSGAGFQPVGANGALFSGMFNGLGHTVSGLYINRPATNYVGLLGYTGGTASVRNVGIVGSAITGQNHVGALVGLNIGALGLSYASGNISGNQNVGGLVGNAGSGSVIDGSFATSVVIGSVNVGGLVGYTNTDTSISNSFASGNVSITGNTGDSCAGGLVGENYGTISNSHASGNVSNSGSYSGGLTGGNHAAITNSYATGTVGGVSNIGGLTGSNFSTISGSYATGAVTASSSYAGGLIARNYGTVTSSHAEGDVSGTSNTGGLVAFNTGSVSSAYAIGDVTGTSSVGGLVGYANSSSSVDNAYATGAVVGSSSVGGLVGYANTDSTLSNSHAEGTVTVAGNTGSTYAGGLVGQSLSSISSSYATGNVSSSGQYVGGLVGYQGSGTTISDSHAAGDVDALSVAGGLVGSSYAAISNSYATGKITGGGQIAGLTGINYTSITNSYYLGDVISTANEIGGLVGRNYGTVSSSHSEGSVTGTSSTGGLVGFNVAGKTIEDSYSTSTVNGTVSVGGLVGYNSGGTVDSSYATGSVTGTGSFVGGLVGRTLDGSAITDSYASGDVSGVDYVGGLVGINIGTVSGSHASGTVTGTTGGVGGLVGTNESSGSITSSYATSQINAESQAGGLAGRNYGLISGSYYSGTISASSYEIGGLVGRNYGTISTSYTSGSVSGTTSIGGLVGYNTSGKTITDSYSISSVSGTGGLGGLVGYNSGGTITTSYAAGAVSGSGTMGGLVGTNTGTVTNSFWNITTSGQASSAGGTGKTTADMKAFATFSGATWSISQSGTTTPSGSTVWAIYDGLTYPLLKTFMSSLTITANSVSRGYDGTAYTAGGPGVVYSPVSYDAGLLSGTLAYAGGFDGAVNAGTYAITPTGLYSGQNGYDIAYVSGTLTITPAALTVTASDQTKVYGTIALLGDTAFSVSGTLYGADAVEGVALTSAGSDATASQGAYAISAANATGTGVSNYTITYVEGTLTVDPAALTITVQNQSKRYGTALNLGSTAFDVSGLVEGDSVSGVTLTSAGAQSMASPGAYAISARDAVGTGLGNYAITYASGLLTVDPSSTSGQSVVGAFVSGASVSSSLPIFSVSASVGLCPLPTSVIGGGNSPLTDVSEISLLSAGCGL